MLTRAAGVYVYTRARLRVCLYAMERGGVSVHKRFFTLGEEGGRRRLFLKMKRQSDAGGGDRAEGGRNLDSPVVYL